MGKPDYTFKNGDTVAIGFDSYQVINGTLKKVIDYVPIEGQEHHYIKPGFMFTYKVLRKGNSK
jgi:hypothetical protein